MDYSLSRVSASEKINQLGSSDVTFEALESIVYKLSEEVHLAMRELAKLADIDPDQIDYEDIGVIKRLLAEKHIAFVQYVEPMQPFRTFIEAQYNKEFIVGYLIFLNLQLNVIKRIRIDNLDERITALSFLKGGDYFDSIASNKR